jgi:hypothetical protein
MPLSQITRIPDEGLNAKLTPANDNFNPTIRSIESLEAESVLAQRDYTRPRKRNKLGLIVALCVGILAFLVLKLAGAISVGPFVP